MEENDEEAMILDKSDDVIYVPNARDENALEDVRDGKVNTGSKTDILRNIFLASAGEDPNINSIKLQCIIAEVFPDIEFSLDLSRSLLALMDRDLSGSIDYYEFQHLVDSLRKWVSVYESKKDKDTNLLSGRAWGLGDALKDLGYQLPRRLQSLVVVRYGNEEGNISLRDFLMVASRFSVMMERFNNRSENGNIKATLNLSEWLQDTIYC